MKFNLDLHIFLEQSLKSKSLTRFLLLLMLLLFLGISANAKQLSGLAEPNKEQMSKPLLNYTFDQDPSGLVKDLSSYGNDGKIVGDAKYFDELDGRRGVLRFDGKSYIQIGDSEALDFEGDLSFEMWVRLNKEPSQAWGHVFGDWPVRDWCFSLAYCHTLVLHYRDGYSSNALPVDRSLIDTEWAHVAVVVEYPNSRFYRNGELVHDQYMAVSGVPNQAQITKFIAGTPDANICMPLDLDSFRFYRRALTADEISAHANAKEIPSRRTEEMVIETNWYTDTITFRITGKNEDYSNYTSVVTINDAKGKTVQTVPFNEAFSGSGRFTAEAKLSLDGREGEKIEAKADIVNSEGTKISELVKSTVLTKPEWIDNNYGYFQSVPAPWTPVETSKKDDSVRVAVWGREYEFGKTHFINSIKTQNAELFAKPISLKCIADGKEQVWTESTVKLTDTMDKAAVIAQVFDSENAQLRINTQLEFDGYMIVDMVLEGKRDINLDKLILDIPLKSEYAKLCYGDRVLPRSSPQIPYSEWFSGAIKGDLAFHFGPSIMISNRNLGLLWQSETDADWHNENIEKQIEILPRGEVTYFRNNFVDETTSIKSGEILHYRFALQALPIKPLKQDAWDMRIVRYEPWGREFELHNATIEGQPAIEYLRKKGVRDLYVYKLDLLPWPMPIKVEFSENLHKLVDAVHSGGLKLHPYLIHQRVPVLIPGFDPHGTHMANFPVRQYVQGANYNKPERPGPVETGPGATPQSTVFMCPKSMALADAYIYSLAQRMKTYGEDGIYLDGTVHIPPCENILHGCGYHDDKGKLHKTYPVFAVRQFMQRIHGVVKGENPENVIDIHCSWGFNPAGLAYGDILWTGEQWFHLRHSGSDYIAGDLTHDLFLTEFTGWQIGIGSELLTYRLGARSKVAAVSLLYDIPARPTLRDNKDDQDYWNAITKVWALRDRFDAQSAEKLFFFENSQYVESSADKVYVTLLKHPTNGVLAFISNLNREPQVASIAFNLKALGLNDSHITVLNGMTGEPINLEANDAITVSLGSHEWLYVWLSSNNNLSHKSNRLEF